MRIVFWIGCMLASVALGHWMGAHPLPSEFTPNQTSEEITLLGKRFPTRYQAIPLKDHPCLTATAEALPVFLKNAQDRSVSGTSSEVLLIVAHWFQSDREG
jgi:hypothetical protein